MANKKATASERKERAGNDSKGAKPVKKHKKKKCGKGSKTKRAGTRSKGRKVLKMMKKPAARAALEMEAEPDSVADDGQLVLPKKPKAKGKAKGRGKGTSDVAKMSEQNEADESTVAEPGKRARRRSASTRSRSSEAASKKSFARRFPPQGGFALLKWKSLREAFLAVIADEIEAPSSFEVACLCKEFRLPKLRYTPSYLFLRLPPHHKPSFGRPIFSEVPFWNFVHKEFQESDRDLSSDNIAPKAYRSARNFLKKVAGLDVAEPLDSKIVDRIYTAGGPRNDVTFSRKKRRS